MFVFLRKEGCFCSNLYGNVLCKEQGVNMSIVQQYFPRISPLFLFDASAFIYRGFYAYSSMQRKDGFPTSAIYNVARVLLKILKQEQPTHFAFILDGVGKSFRHEIFHEYKQNRSKTPEDLIAQIAPIEHMVSLLGIPILISHDAEADDYIASLAHQYESDGIVIVGVDKDLRQCLTPNVLLWDPSAKEERIVTYSQFIEETGLLPSQWPDFQAIIGDTSDNIPGIKGIGEKTAYKIFEQYKTLEDIEAHLDNFEGKIKTKLVTGLHDAYIYRKLTRLSTTCYQCEKENLHIRAPQAEIIEFIQEYELFSLRRDIESLGAVYGVDFPSRGHSMMEQSHHERDTSLNSASEEQFTLFTATPHIDILMHETTASPSTFSMLPQASDKTITLFIHENSLTVRVNGNNYHIKEFTEDEFVHYMCDIDECITIDVKSIFKLYPSLLSISTVWKDIAIMAYLLNPEEREYTIESIYAVWGESLPTVPETMVECIYAMSLLFIEQLHASGVYELYCKIEQPLCSILSLMENEGIGLDIKALQSLLVSVEKQIHSKEQEIYELVGHTFNIRSSQQLGAVLFTEMGLQHKSKTKTGHFSTSQETLEKLADAHPIISTILEFRMLEKLRSTYLEPLPKYADEKQRLHTTFNQLATATGRLSSSNPNLQNIPIRGIFGGPIRNCFCASSGNLLIAADYSQIELRILAYLSKEPTLMDAFARNEDIHRKTASVLYDIALEDVTQEQRRNAKAINFGLLYGMGATKLARETKTTLREAKEFMDRYFERLGNIRQLYADIIEGAKAKGYVTTLFGRRRYLPDIQSGNEQIASQARRQAVNTVIQGTAADIIKKAMVDISNNEVYTHMGARLILQIHDELIMEVPEKYADITAQSMVDDMTHITWGEFGVPLIVEYGIALTWGKAH